jgi:hypothetical protein
MYSYDGKKLQWGLLGIIDLKISHLYKIFMFPALLLSPFLSGVCNNPMETNEEV